MAVNDRSAYLGLDVWMRRLSDNKLLYYRLIEPGAFSFESIRFRQETRPGVLTIANRLSAEETSVLKKYYEAAARKRVRGFLREVRQQP